MKTALAQPLHVAALMSVARLRLLSLAVVTIAMAACAQSPATPAPAVQAAACNYQVSPRSVGVGYSGGSAAVSVNADAGTCSWTASTPDEWIHFAGPTTGQGTGVLKLDVDTRSPLLRRGTVTVSWNGGATPISVDQGCLVPVTKTENLTPERQIYLTSTQGGCTFLTGRPIEFDVPWIHFVSTHGSGFQLELLVDANTGPERTGHVITELGVITIVQAPGNCVTAIAPTSQAFDENGGRGTFTVTGVPGCPWDATPYDDATYQLALYHGIGDGVVVFNMPVNGTSGARSWYYLVGGALRFQITQSACVLKCGQH